MGSKKNLLITFNNMTEAVRMEALLSKNGIRGELMPTPRHLSRGCAYSLRMSNRQNQMARSLIQQHKGKASSWLEVD